LTRIKITIDTVKLWKIS